MRKVLLSMLALAAIAGSHRAMAQQYTSLDCGMQFTVALRSDSTLWAWGFDGNGQLGAGAGGPMQGTLSQAAPGQLFIGAAAGGFHTLAIAADSSLWGWGSNSVGQLGITAAATLTPMQVDAGKWRSVSGGYGHSAAIRADGTLWTAGFNYSGQLGVGDTLDRAAWTQVGTDNDWKSVSCGGYHTLALKNDGSLWVWGLNGNGQLGTGGSAYSDKVPQAVATGEAFRMVSAGFEFSTALRSDSTLWAWGFNGNGQTGQGSGGAASQPTPAQVGTDADWTYLSAGSSFAFGIRTDGTLWGWGYNGRGQLGTGGATTVFLPVQVGPDTDWRLVAASDGGAVGGNVFGLHAAGLRQDGQSICTAGDNQGAQLGLEEPSGVTMQDYFGCGIGALPTSAGTITAAVPAVTVFPNPAHESLLIRAEGAAPLTATVLSTDGRVVWQGALSRPLTIVPISEWAHGVYLVQARDERGSLRLSQRVVVQ